MDTDDIKRLLEAFYDGDTTIEEEQILISYFTGDEVDAELLHEKEYFVRLGKLTPAPLPSDFTAKIDNLFEGIAEQEKTSGRQRRMLLWAASAVASIAVIFFIGYYWNGNPDIDSRLVATDSVKQDRQVSIPLANIPPTEVNAEVKPDTAKEAVRTETVKETKAVKPRSTKKTADAGNKKLEEDMKKMAEALELVSTSINKGLDQVNLVSENLSQTSEVLNSKQN